MLRSDHRERYASVEAVEADLRNYFEGRPIEARRGSFRYVFGKFVRRYAVYVAAAAVVMLALVGGLIGTSVALHRANNLADESVIFTIKRNCLTRKQRMRMDNSPPRFEFSAASYPESRFGSSARIQWFHLWRACTEQGELRWFPNAGGEILALGGSPPSLICTSAGKEPRVTSVT